MNHLNQFPNGKSEQPPSPEGPGNPTLKDTYAQLVSEMRAMIDALPIESAGVRERRRLIEVISREQYWLSIDSAKYQVLTLEVAPLMRYLPGINLDEATFDIHCLNALAALFDGDQEAARSAARSIREDILRLPIDHPDVAPERGTIEQRWDEDWVEHTTMEEILDLRRRLGPLMRHRQAEPTTIITLDLADALQEQRWIEVGPDATPFEITDYQRQISERVQELARSSPIFAKLARGEQLEAHELEQAADLLDRPNLFADEKALQRAWRAPHASLVAIVGHVLGVSPLVSREDAINAAFSAFLAGKSYLQADQLTFVRLFVRRLIDTGHVDLADLYDHPFTTLTTDPEKLLPLGDLEEMLLLAEDFGVR